MKLIVIDFIVSIYNFHRLTAMNFGLKLYDLTDMLSV